MDDPFQLPVTYKGQEVYFPACLLQLGYTHKFAIDVHGQEIFFEPDEEQTYRAVLTTAQLESSKPVDVELLKAIAEAIEAILK